MSYCDCWRSAGPGRCRSPRRLTGLQVHVTSVTHAIRRLEADGLVQRVPHPTDGRTTLVQITDLGRSTVEDASVTLNEQVFSRHRDFR